jgi:capsular exopolysaccharide synthesis family protein
MDRIKRALQKNKSRQQHVLLEQTAPAQKLTVIRPHEDIEYSQTRTIKVSKSILAENRIIAGNQSDPRATYFRMLRTQVLQAMRENDWSSLAVTGPLAGVGKSLVATNLAISISMEVNQTVLLVDMDLRRPALHKYFDFEPEFGLLDYLTNDAELPDILVNPTFKRLVLLPGRGTTSESSELLSSPRMLDLIKELKSRYESRIVIYDLAPLLNVDDAMVILPHVDSTILVVENGKNTQSEVQNSLRLLEGTNLIGTVLNKSDEEIQGYY